MMMALVGRIDGRNFGYGRQLSYVGPQAKGLLLPATTSPRSKLIAIAGSVRALVSVRTVPVTTMRARSIDGCCWTTPLRNCRKN